MTEQKLSSKPVVSNKQLRIFGLIIVAFVALIIGFVLPKFMQWQAGYSAWGSLLLFTLATIVNPTFLTSFYKGWIVLGDVLARVNTFITLMLVWLVLFIPIGLIMKVCRYDPLKRSFDYQLKSYRVERQIPLDKSSLERPF